MRTNPSAICGLCDLELAAPDRPRTLRACVLHRIGREELLRRATGHVSSAAINSSSGAGNVSSAAKNDSMPSKDGSTERRQKGTRTRVRSAGRWRTPRRCTLTSAAQSASESRPVTRRACGSDPGARPARAQHGGC
eukprot:378330-Rhodomonas_salina.3